MFKEIINTLLLSGFPLVFFYGTEVLIKTSQRNLLDGVMTFNSGAASQLQIIIDFRKRQVGRQLDIKANLGCSFDYERKDRTGRTK